MPHPNTVYRKKKRHAVDGTDFFRSEEHHQGGVEVTRQGATRPYVNARSFWPALTDRQKRRGGKAKTARSWGRVLKTLSETGMTMDEFVQGLSVEELARGQVKDKNGNFTGRPPSFVPRAFHRACIAELMRRGKTLWQENYIGAIETMTKIMRDSRVKPSDRLKAATFVIERLEGKVPEKLIVETDQPWALVINDIVADVTDEAVGRAQKALNGARDTAEELMDVVDAELVDEEEEVAPPPRRPVRSQRRRRT